MIDLLTGLEAVAIPAGCYATGLMVMKGQYNEQKSCVVELTQENKALKAEVEALRKRSDQTTAECNTVSQQLISLANAVLDLGLRS